MRILKIFLPLMLMIFIKSSASFAEGINTLHIQEQLPINQSKTVRLKTNLVPWAATIPNLGAEITFGNHWSAALDIWYCPWKISQSHSLKTAAILPEGRWWPKTNQKGHFLDFHLSVVWYNLRWNSYRYQDIDRPLLGAGIGYGYLLKFNPNWGIEFSIGIGIAQSRYDRFYNITNGALADTRQTFYWGIDRLGISVFYNIGDL